MRFYLVSALLISFVAIAVFGFAMMDPDNGHMGCIAAMAQGATSCPGAFDMVSLHLNAFNMFSSAVFGVSMSSIMVAILALLLSFLWFLFDFNNPNSVFIFNKNKSQSSWIDSAGRFRQKTWRWLVTLEKRDPLHLGLGGA